MRYKRLPSELFIKNRKKFSSQLKDNSLAVFTSNDIFSTSADSTVPFIQQTDMYYLSGVDQEESILVLFPDAVDEKNREVLFVRETSESIRIWEGEKLTKEVAREQTGIQTVHWLKDFDRVFKTLVCESEIIYLNTNEHLRANTEMETRNDRFNKWCQKEFPSHIYDRSAPIMHQIRSVKEPEEIQCMQHACDITHEGLKRALAFIKPGVWEYEIEAEILYAFKKRASRRFAYTPIIASGGNACVLHYIENHAQCQDGDLILMDFGSEYAGYCSDLTRTVPVNGRFTDRQKAIYNAVLRVKNEATEMLVPGAYLHEYHKEVGKLMQSELLDLGLLDKADIQNQDEDWPAYKKYFMHGTSHFIGLDTHDVGLWHEPIQAGMAFTVEPGIYILEENIGIRLEDDVVVQSGDSPLNLMKNIPIEVEEIEELMQSQTLSTAE